MVIVCTVNKCLVSDDDDFSKTEVYPADRSKFFVSFQKALILLFEFIKVRNKPCEENEDVYLFD